MNLLTGVVILFLGVTAAWSEGRKPEEKKTPKEHSSSLHDAKETANNALISVDKGVHAGLKAANNGAESALEAVDKGVHKMVGKEKSK